MLRWLFSCRWKFSLICIKTAPYLATTCKELFLRCQQKNLKVRGSDFAILVALIWGCLRSCRKNICEIIKHIPPKKLLFVAIKWRDFFVLSDEFLEKRQSFPFICRVIMRGLFNKGTQSLFYHKISSQTSIFWNLVSLFIWRGLKKKNIKLLAKPCTDT